MEMSVVANMLLHDVETNEINMLKSRKKIVKPQTILTH